VPCEGKSERIVVVTVILSLLHIVIHNRMHTVKMAHNLTLQQGIIRVLTLGRMGRTGHELHMEQMRHAYIILVGKSQMKIPLSRPRNRWKINVNIVLL
jgi:hypothetical protein